MKCAPADAPAEIGLRRAAGRGATPRRSGAVSFSPESTSRLISGPGGLLSAPRTPAGGHDVSSKDACHPPDGAKARNGIVWARAVAKMQEMACPGAACRDPWETARAFCLRFCCGRLGAGGPRPCHFLHLGQGSPRGHAFSCIWDKRRSPHAHQQRPQADRGLSDQAERRTGSSAASCGHAKRAPAAPLSRARAARPGRAARGTVHCVPRFGCWLYAPAREQRPEGRHP